MAQQRHVRVRSWQVTLILTLFFISLAGAAGIGWWYAREAPPHQGPIVLITVDGLPPTTIAPRPPVDGAAAPEAPEVPGSAIDALAADSVIFEHAYTHAAQLLPSQASLLSGQLPFEHGVRDDSGFVMDRNVRTLPELLRNRGFSTGASVSSFLLRRDTGIARGFAYYGDGDAADLQPVAAARPADGSAAPPSIDPVSLEREDVANAEAQTADEMLTAAESWATGQHGQRYFLMLQVDAAHADAAVGRIVTLLRERRLYDGATIVLVGDRGREQATLDDETLHVPMLVKQPQHEGAGRRVDAPVQHIDLLPTILDLVRAPIPGGLRGRSLKPLLTETDARLTPQPVYSESLAPAFRFGGRPAFALTLNGFRYVRSDSEQLHRIGAVAVPLDNAQAPDAPAELPLLRATLDRLLSGRMIGRASPVLPRDRDRLAAAGSLAGLANVDEESGLTSEEQEAVFAAHRDAARLVGERRVPAAIRALQQIARSHPSLAAVHYQVGKLSLELGRTQEAIAALELATTLRPGSPEVLGQLALALSRAGRHGDAQMQVERAVEAATPLDASALAAAHEIGVRVALAHADAAMAASHAEAVEAANPAIPMRAYVQARLLAESGSTDEAARMLEEAAATLRQHEGAIEGLQLALGDALAKGDNPVLAEAAFREELRYFPRNVQAYHALATLLHGTGRPEEASAVIDAMLASAPTPDAYAAAVKLWTAFGNPARAAELRSDARARFPIESQQARSARARPR